MKEIYQVVLVIDDDPLMREAITSLIEAAGLACQTFASSHEFLNADFPDVPRCVVLDVRLPRLSALTLRQELADRAIQIPIIALTGPADIPMRQQTLAGELVFLSKRVREEDLLSVIEEALVHDRLARNQQSELIQLVYRYELLSPRQREVMQLVVVGLRDKQIALELDMSQKTVAAHRNQLMESMGTNSLPELVRAAQKLNTLLRLRVIEQAIQRDRLGPNQRSELSELEERYELLSPRLRAVMHLVAAGLYDKTARKLGISEKTVAIQLGRLMERMGTNSLAELVRMARKLNTLPTVKKIFRRESFFPYDLIAPFSVLVSGSGLSGLRMF